MSRVCDVTGKKPMFGNKVSHANNKSRRRFDVNLQKKRFWLPDEKRFVTLKVSTRGMRIIDKKGIRIKKRGILQTMEIKKPLDIDYENDSVEDIVEMIEYAIEQHPSFLKVIPQEELEKEEQLNQTRRWDY